MTQGGSLLKKWLEGERRSQGWLADQLGTHQTNVSRWIRGEFPPPIAAAISIRGITGIEVEEWAKESDESGRLPTSEAAKAG